MNYKNIFVGIASICMLFLGLYLYRPIVNVDVSPTETNGGLGLASGVQHQQAESFLQGLAAGPRDQLIVDNVGTVIQNGADHFGRANSTSQNAVGTTTCPVLTPNATTTGLTLAIQMTRNSTTTNGSLSIGTSTGPYATTSPLLVGIPIYANTKTSIAIRATTTESLVNTYGSKYIFPPNTYVVFSLSGGTFALSSSKDNQREYGCSVTFDGLQ